MSQSIATPSQTITLNQRVTNFAHALAFVIGFSLIFIIGWGRDGHACRPALWPI